MATIVNNPAPGSDNGMGFLLGIIILVVIGALFYFFALPYIRQGMSGDVQVNVPKDINVNVKQSE